MRVYIVLYKYSANYPPKGTTLLQITLRFYVIPSTYCSLVCIANPVVDHCNFSPGFRLWIIAHLHSNFISGGRFFAPPRISLIFEQWYQVFFILLSVDGFFGPSAFSLNANVFRCIWSAFLYVPNKLCAQSRFQMLI